MKEEHKSQTSLFNMYDFSSPSEMKTSLCRTKFISHLDLRFPSATTCWWHSSRNRIVLEWDSIFASHHISTVLRIDLPGSKMSKWQLKTSHIILCENFKKHDVLLLMQIYGVTSSVHRGTCIYYSYFVWNIFVSSIIDCRVLSLKIT